MFFKRNGSGCSVPVIANISGISVISSAVCGILSRSPSLYKEVDSVDTGGRLAAIPGCS